MTRNMQAKYVRRRRVVSGILMVAGLVVAYYLVNHMWWTESNFCFGDIYKCESGF